MAWSDAEYFRQRAQSERDLAAAATNPLVAEVHIELAQLYEKQVGAGDGPRLRPVRSGETPAGPA